MDIINVGGEKGTQLFSSPGDLTFWLTGDGWGILRSQSATSSSAPHGGRRYAPYAFTEQGVAMLSSVLRSRRAVEVNIQIMRAFVRLRQLLSVHKDLAERLAKLEEQMRQRDHAVAQQLQQVFALLDQLFNPPGPFQLLILSLPGPLRRLWGRQGSVYFPLPSLPREKGPFPSSRF